MYECACLLGYAWQAQMIDFFAGCVSGSATVLAILSRRLLSKCDNITDMPAAMHFVCGVKNIIYYTCSPFSSWVSVVCYSVAHAILIISQNRIQDLT